MTTNYFNILGNTLRMEHNNLAIIIILVQILVIESANRFQFFFFCLDVIKCFFWKNKLGDLGRLSMLKPINNITKIWIKKMISRKKTTKPKHNNEYYKNKM
jgi:hypothetical protein